MIKNTKKKNEKETRKEMPNSELIYRYRVAGRRRSRRGISASGGPGRSEAVRPSLRLIQRFGRCKTGLNHRCHYDLGDPHSRFNGKILVAQIYQWYENLTPIVAVDRTRCVEDRHAGPYRQSRARPYLRFESRRQSHAKSRWNRGSLSRSENDVGGDTGTQIRSGGARGRVFRDVTVLGDDRNR